MGEGTYRAEERVVSDAEPRGAAGDDRGRDRGSSVEAGSGHRQARAGRQRSLLSPDESWWWNGRRWVSAKTEDGLWAWNGTRWRTTIELEGKPPQELARALVEQADERRMDAGAILAARAAEWQPEAELRELVARAEKVAARLHRSPEPPASAPNRRLLGRRPAAIGSSHPNQAERQELRAQQRTLHAQIGRLAPHPTVKEADDALASASLLEEHAALLAAALGEVRKAERLQAEAREAVRRELAAAEGARQEMIRRAEKRVEDARAAQARALVEASREFRSSMAPGKGELEAGLGRLHLHSRVLNTPSGSLSTRGLKAFEGTAPALWLEHRELLTNLMLLDLPETASFLTALVTQGDTLFLLFKSHTGAALWVCPAGQEVAARRFLATLREQVLGSVGARQDWEERARQAERHLAAVARDRSSIEAAEAELELVRTDRGLLAAIEQAREKLQQSRSAIPQLVQANRKLDELMSRLLTPPEPLALPAPEGAS
jgi:hypothetical protein